MQVAPGSYAHSQTLDRQHVVVDICQVVAVDRLVHLTCDNAYDESSSARPNRLELELGEKVCTTAPASTGLR